MPATSPDAASLALACAEAGAADPAGPLHRERMLAGAYALAHYPDADGVPAVARQLAGNVRTMITLAGWVGRHPRPAVAGPALEIGCGPGRFLVEIAARVPAGVIGCDLRPGFLRIGRRLLDAGAVALPWRAEVRAFRPLVLRRPRPAGGPIGFVQGSLLRPPFAAAGIRWSPRCR
jgi:SAM-dependent methyltransferase